ncbi:MAG: HAMP domain-containing methyl-accepting chemotaxis protein [bacterium]
MNWIKNLKISQKILTLVVLMVVFLGIIGYIGYYFNAKTGAELKDLYTSRLASVEAMGRMNEDSSMAIQNLFQFMINIDPATNNRLNNSINKHLAQIDKDFKDYLSTPLDPYEVERVHIIKNNLHDYLIAVNKAQTKAYKNENSQAYKIYLESEGHVNIIHKAIVEIINYNNNEGKKLYLQSEKDATFANVFLMLSILSISALTLFIGSIMAKIISAPINNVVNSLSQVALGNLSLDEVKVDSKDETGILASSLNTTVKNLRHLIIEVAKSTEEICASSEEMAASADQTAQGSQQTASTTAQMAQGAQEISKSVEHGAVTINRMNKAIQEISEDAKIVAKLGNDSEVNANQGSKHVQNAIEKIDNIKTVSADISVTVAKLGTLSSEIETIVDLIKGIAGQTNLLSLNAAIEAARAGEHGKGFAVVAEEVKKLATQSAEATDKITDMIKEIQSQTGLAVSKMDKATNEVKEGVAVVNEAGKALNQIISQVKTANSKIQEITKEIDGVAHNSNDVVKMIENISAITEQTAASAEEISSITQEQTASIQEISAGSQVQAKVAENLQTQMSVFKV